MTVRPLWSAVDSSTADLLTLASDKSHPSANHEWEAFVEALRTAADASDVIRPNALRPLVRGVVAPRRIGAFTNRALAEGLVEYTGDWQVSDDLGGRNAGKPARIMRLIGEPS